MVPGIGSWLTKRAVLTPDKEAAVDGEKRFTYKVLNGRVNRLAGALQGLGVLLFAWALLVTDLWAFIGLRQLSPSGEPAEKLVVHGPYRWVRHPLYSASLLVLWFSPLMSLNLLAFNLGVTAYFVIGGVFEERKLLRQFGPAYAAYRARTPMLIPLRFPES